jgi:hypothetical protein
MDAAEVNAVEKKVAFSPARFTRGGENTMHQLSYSPRGNFGV